MPVDVDDARAYKCGVGNRMFHSVVGIGVERKHPNATVCADVMEKNNGHAHRQSVFREVVLVDVLRDLLVLSPPSVASRKLNLMDLKNNWRSMEKRRPPHALFEPSFFD